MEPHMTGTLDCDVAIIGAGPGGAMAALACARRGDSVVLIDKASFPRDKVCGCCLSQAALRELRLAGLDEMLLAHHAVPLERITLASAGTQATLQMNLSYSLSRSSLDAAIIDAAVAAGATFVTASASLGSSSDGHRMVNLHTSGSEPGAARNKFESIVRAKVVLVASGLASKVLDDELGFESIISPSSRVGASSIFDDGPAYYTVMGGLHMAIAQHGYVGLARVEDGRLNVAAAFDAPFMRECGSAGRAASMVLQNAGFPTWPGLINARWQGSPYLTRTRAKFAAPRLLVLGDAAGYVEPFTGEGMGWAMQDGVAAASMLSTPWSDRTEQMWNQHQLQTVRPRQRHCRFLSRLLRHARIVPTVLSVLARFPRAGGILLPKALA
jgi:menaquinone-9 beta-reductase